MFRLIAAVKKEKERLVRELPFRPMVLLLMAPLLFLYLSGFYSHLEIFPWQRTRAGSWEAGEAPPETIRFHVKAHSNRPGDQHIKNELAEMILNAFGPSWRSCKNSDELSIMLSADLDLLQEAAQVFLQEQGFPQQVQIALGKRFFPARSYARELYPPGEYEALYVTIGDGAGENWWCVLFPPLCFHIIPGGEVKNDALYPKMEPKGQPCIEEKGKPPGRRWRFWLLELLRGSQRDSLK